MRKITSPHLPSLQAFLYLLLRDHLSFGKVERIALELSRCRGKSIQYSERQMAQYARSLALHVLTVGIRDDKPPKARKTRKPK